MLSSRMKMHFGIRLNSGFDVDLLLAVFLFWGLLDGLVLGCVVNVSQELSASVFVANIT
jgi:hypothetical protein